MKNLREVVSEMKTEVELIFNYFFILRKENVKNGIY